MPFLHGAIIRLLEEYPACSNGLSRTAQQALTIVSLGDAQPARIFGLNQESEDRVFLGDSSFWFMLQELLDSSPPLLNLSAGERLKLPIDPNQELAITQMGKDVLAGKRNYLELVGMGRWIGDVHLTPQNMWCWNSAASSIVKQ